MNEHPNIVKKALISVIKEMSASPALFVKDPERNFTRKRKLPFETMLRLLLSMGGYSLSKNVNKCLRVFNRCRYVFQYKRVLSDRSFVGEKRHANMIAREKSRSKNIT